MATSSSLQLSSPFLSAGSSVTAGPNRNNLSVLHTRKRVGFKIQAAKLPAGVEFPKEQPKFQPPFAGFTRTAEIWNSRACMIGLIGTFIVELILNKGILELIGVEIGKGLDIPL